MSRGVRRVLDTADHIHVTGSSLSSAEFVAVKIEAAEAIKARGHGILRPKPAEGNARGTRAARRDGRVLALTDLFLPSGEELTLLTAAQTEAEAFRELLGRPALIDATCNQVNRDGGYTGMTPADFRRFVEETADRAGCDKATVILGGDHLGLNAA